MNQNIKNTVSVYNMKAPSSKLIVVNDERVLVLLKIV